MKKKIISLFTVTVLLFSLLLTGCSSNTAKDTANAMCSIILKCKLDDGEKFGIKKSDEDELIKQYQDQIKDQFKQNLSMVGYVPNDSELDSVCEAYKDALSKVTYEIKEGTKSGDETDVEISTNSINMKQIDEKAAMDALDETDKMEFATVDEGNKKYGEIYMQKIAENLKNAELSSEKSSNTFKFKKQDKFWVPEDPKNFGFKLVRLATNNDKTDLSIDEDIASPTESAEAIWNLVIKQDTSSMDKLGYSEAFAKRMIKNIQKQDFDTIKSEFSGSQFNLSDEQLKEMVDSLEKAIAKTKVKFEEVSKTDNSAKVKVSSNSIDFNSIVNKTVQVTKQQAIDSMMTSEDQFYEAYFNNLVSAIQNAELTTDENDKTFAFTKVGDIWMPSDSKSYVMGIAELTMK